MQGLKAAIALLCLTLASSSLSGCCYRPLYGRSALSGGTVSSDLSGIVVEEQKTRAGQLVRNELLSAIAPAGTAGAPRYSLSLAVTERIISTFSATADKLQRKRIRLAASYSLTEIATGKVVNSGKSFSDVSYDQIREPVADLQAETNARERAATDLGNDLRLRLAALFAGRN